MAKNSISDYDETAANNTDVAGINIDEGCNPSGMNNAIRAVMSHLKAFFKGSVFRLRDATDQTKLLAFDLSGITTGTTRTLTAPNASGTVMLTSTALANAQALDTSVVQSAHGAYTNNSDLTAVIPFDDTIPRWDEGTLILTVSITPRSTANKLRCRFYAECSIDTLAAAIAALFVNPALVSTPALRAVYTTIPTAGYAGVVAMEYEFTPGVTTQQEVSIRLGPNTGTMRLNGNTTGRIFGGVMAATLTVEEVKG